jgi:hypothetical protein
VAPAGTGVAGWNPQVFKVLLVVNHSDAQIRKRILLRAFARTGAFAQILSGRQTNVVDEGRPAHWPAGVCNSASNLGDAR